MLCSFLLALVYVISYSSQSMLPQVFRFTANGGRHSLKWRRAVSSDVSCTQSPIQYNMTLKGGIEAGYFRKLAEHVAMQLCIELCCEEKGCDVAFMSGKNCYGVQCFNEEMCRGLPPKKPALEPVMIAHVTFKGERVVPTEQAAGKLQCSATRMKIGVTLRGGLKAGNYTDVGVVMNMPMCVKLCCVSEKCDVALMIDKSCFMVSCYTKKLCEMVKALSNMYRPSLAYVMRRREVLNETATSLHVLDTSANQLVCKNSQVFYNTTLKGGYKAGNYTNFGKVANMSACMRLCCGNKDCDAAMMLENNCFAVACRDSDNCLPVHAKSSSSLEALNPRISYITSRSEEVYIHDQLTSDGTCHAGIISYDVSLKGGSAAGNFTPHGKIGSMENCIYKCCQMEGCSVAMMLKNTCFTVVCKKDELCEKKQTPTSSNFNPKIAYVFKEKSKTAPTIKESKERMNKNTKLKLKKKTLLAEQLYALTNSPTSFINQLEIVSATTVSSFHSTMKKTTPSKRITTKHHTSSTHAKNKLDEILTAAVPMVSNNSLLLKSTDNSSMSFKGTTPKNVVKATIEPLPNKNASQDDSSKDSFLTSFLESTLPIQNISKNTTQHPIQRPLLGPTKPSHFQEFNLTTSVPSNRTANVTLPTVKDPRFKVGISLVEDDPKCKSSEVLYNVTLRGGLRSGKFKDRGEMEDIKQCVKLCCLLEKCDLAFMLSKTCFTVNCIDEVMCDAVPARSAIFQPTICYVYVKSEEDS